jgi:hypothetical protein
VSATIVSAGAADADADAVGLSALLGAELGEDFESLLALLTSVDGELHAMRPETKAARRYVFFIAAP